MKRIDEWDEVWQEPSTRSERWAPFVALALAVMIASWL